MSTTTDSTTSTNTAATGTRSGDRPTVTVDAARTGGNRWTDSPVLVGLAAVICGSALTVLVAATVVTLTGSPSPTPVTATVATTAERVSAGDARQGLTPDAATRRLGGTSPFFRPDSADSAGRRAAVAGAGLLAEDSADSALRRTLLTGLLAPDSANSADRRRSAVDLRPVVTPDSADSATRRTGTGSARSASAARTGHTADSNTRRSER